MEDLPNDNYLYSCMVSPGLAQDQVSKMMQIEQRICPFVKFLKDGLSVKYEGKGLLYTDAAAIQGSTCLDPKNVISYFEVKVNQIGQRGDMAVGLTGRDFPQNKLPGMTKTSIGFKSDGRIYTGKKSVSSIRLPLIATGDIVGCGLNHRGNTVFFTLNGTLLDTISNPIHLQHYIPTIGLHSLNQSLTFNFIGKPYLFDLHSLINKYKMNQVQQIHAQILQPVDVHKIVLEYLGHHGYEETKRVFSQECHLTDRYEGERNREGPLAIIRQEVIGGSLDKAKRLLQIHFKGLLENDHSLMNTLNCYLFIERIKKNDILAAIQFLQDNLSDQDVQQNIQVYDEENKVQVTSIQNVVGLLCYEDGQDSPLGVLLEDKQKGLLADHIQKAVFAHLGAPHQSLLSSLIQQTLHVNHTLTTHHQEQAYSFHFNF